MWRGAAEPGGSGGALAESPRRRPGRDGRRRHPTIDAFGRMPVEQAQACFGEIRFKGRAALIARDILPEIRERLKFLERWGWVICNWAAA